VTRPPEFHQAVVPKLELINEPPVPINGDLSSDGSYNVPDIALFFICLCDSVRVLPEDHELIQGMDYNADGRVYVTEASKCNTYLFPSTRTPRKSHFFIITFLLQRNKAFPEKYKSYKSYRLLDVDKKHGIS